MTGRLASTRNPCTSIARRLRRDLSRLYAPIYAMVIVNMVDTAARLKLISTLPRKPGSATPISGTPVCGGFWALPGSYPGKVGRRRQECNLTFTLVQVIRKTEDGTPIDTSGTLFNGANVDGVVGLRRNLVAQPEVFVGVMTEKMLTYALGRGLEYYDMPAVRRVVREGKSSDYRFSSIVLGIARSTPFQMKEAR